MSWIQPPIDSLRQFSCEHDSSSRILKKSVFQGSPFLQVVFSDWNPDVEIESPKYGVTWFRITRWITFIENFLTLRINKILMQQSESEAFQTTALHDWSYSNDTLLAEMNW